MAKSNGMENNGFDIPVTSLAKAHEEGSPAAWMKEVAKEHGDTDPLAVERRRVRLTSYVVAMDSHLKKMQMQKKLFIVRTAKEMKEFEDKSPESPEKQQQLAQMRAYREQEIVRYETLINQCMFQVASVDAQCLAVDCLSLRDDVKSKSGKKGKLRFSACVYNLDAAEFTRKTYNRMRKLYELLANQNPLTAGTVSQDDDDDGNEPDDVVYDDEDVVTEEDRKAIKKEIEGEDFE